MSHVMLVMDLSGKKDVVRARQRARQIAGLLGYEASPQAAIAASVFYLCQQVLTEGITASLIFAVDDRCLRITPVPRDIFLAHDRPADILALSPPASSLQLQQPLPVRVDALPPLDLTWVAEELQRHTTLNVFEEMTRQNQELLATHLELQKCQRDLARLRQASSEPAA
jgi:hypothetical protein